MRFLVMFVTAVCVLFLIKLRWPKKNNFFGAVSAISSLEIIEVSIAGKHYLYQNKS